ncbi:beta and beta-prime subunits of DNA dependent RNA-polymerase [Polychaeton citri CBS 116435]|uniref:DNA-directed RNA polymerase subunit n=1 Tax=Polychaeton citri CBS 116435 TaxID=1314669 RepID=A0A9P4URL7_9PEZI|nr:beta and beta-prime subunits of DNA dependent RNA-polymerase [Polychaeton citri CBS 116435]
MNISNPVGTQLSSVSFGFLSSDDIRALSAKRLTNPTTFDTLLNPTPGGLYDLHLGQFGDNNCQTCGLKTPKCPGHPGHIELPVPVYHPTFMDQTLRLLRATCIYCSRLKLAKVRVHHFGCKLRLLQAGLIKEAKDLDEITSTSSAGKSAQDSESERESGDDDVNQDVKDLMERRERFVKLSISRARQDGTIDSSKTEASTSARRAVIQQFMADITKSKKCANCGGINHSYRKDRFVKIFRKPLSEKERNAMIQSGHKAKDPVLELLKAQKLAEKKLGIGRKRKRTADEGIADMDRSSEEEAEEEEDSSEGEVEIAGGDAMIDDAAAPAALRKAVKQKQQEEYLNPARVLAQLTQMFEREQDILGLIYGGHAATKQKGGVVDPVKADMFFMNTLLVPPNRFRPENHTSDGSVAESQDNQHYSNILRICESMSVIQKELSGSKERDERYRARTYADLETSWTQLQDAVNSMIDRDRNPVQGAAGKRNADGVKQKLEKKEGMFRKYMMGKRVNFAARTVISPDPNIETNEIGVPPVFAIKLTYPEPVTDHNVEELQQAVRNGPFVWPGAIAIEEENGLVINLERKNAEERTALANQLLATGPSSRGTRGKKVHRHLNNGDIVIMNRQPTLHKPSMMCHRAKVLPGEKTLRMHYSNCNTYNADFDGDEMNLHFPQNEVARAEALSIADTDHQYLSGTAGNPLRGLIQDHISMGVAISNKDTFFTRQEYQELLYCALRPENGHCASGKVETLPPAMIKPRKLWTGKQVISTVLLNVKPAQMQGLTLEGKSTTAGNMWGPIGAKEEQNVIFKDGYLCQGVMDKKQIGPSSGGFVNGVYEAYGHTVAGRLLSVLGRLLTRMLSMRAFSCGVEDLLFTRDGEQMRREALAPAQAAGAEIAKEYVTMSDKDVTVGADAKEFVRRMEEVLRDDEKLKGLDDKQKARNGELSSGVTKACLPAALVKPFPRNQMQAMTVSGAKGSNVNANQISCNLGQQTLEGRRVPVMVSGKTLPCFKPFEPSVRAGGFIVDRFLTGVRPQEYYFHAMAGREGLIDTAVKTSRSGYLQRCLIKGMEGLKVEYDTSVRDSDGSVVQFLYGEDGLDVAKSKYLSDFKFTAQNHLSLFMSLGMQDNFERIMNEDARERTKKAEKKYRKTHDLGVMDPALAVYSPSKTAGAMSERVWRDELDYVDSNPDNVVKEKKVKDDPRKTWLNEANSTLSKRNLQGLLDMRYLKSVVEAGEAVGVVAGQSVGEPSTQMTLNTFHLAGHAAKNVTLGIPRLREIVMTAAANIATPTMSLRLNDGISIDDAKKFAKGISKLSLSEILDIVKITESTGKGTAYDSAKRYTVHMELFPSEEYMKEYAITIEDVVATLEHRFLPRLQAATRKELKKRGEEKKLKASGNTDALPDIGKSIGTVEQESGRGEAEREGGDDDSDDEGDDDATRDKAKSNKQQSGYEAYEDDEENLLAQRNQQRDVTPELDSESEDETYGGSPRSSAEPEDDAKAKKSAAKDRENRIRGSKYTNDIVAFAFDDTRGGSATFTLEYDASTAKVLMLNLVENAARAALIQSVPAISGCMVDEQATRDAHVPILHTSGVNLRAMWDYQHVVHPHHIYTNSIHHILTHYGVEAANAAIVRELQAVFGGHGISVDRRHLSLIADYMTRDGAYQAFSRMGYRSNPSPFMKMSFETTVGFLKDAVQDGDLDDLKNPSARIVTGRLNNVGTGGFDVLMPLVERDTGKKGEAKVVEMEVDGESESDSDDESQ